MTQKFIIGFLTVFSSLSFAAPSFVAQGKGYFCYQDFQSALGNAKSEANLNAQRTCRGRASQRISEFAVRQSPQGCVVQVQARYTCR